MKKANQYCAVCDQVKDTLFEIADCGHLFCKDCCVSYIRSQAQNFSKAKCLQEGCSATLNKSKPIYLTLDRATIQRIGNYELFEMLQNNKDAVACRAKDCSGYFLKTSKQPACNTCSALHCLKCLALVHSGACASNKQEEEEMRGLNYRKCPKCAVWVQKSGGCEFINCKCGVEFCFRCGQEYSKDPCRKREVWRKEKEIRQLMNSLKIVVPSDLSSIFLLLLRALLLVAIIIPFTVLYCVVPLVVLGGLVIVLVFLFMPLVVFNGIAYGDCECRWLGYLLAVLFYPVLGALFALLAVFILLLYPFGRNKYHHGMYDPLDMLMCHMAVYYLKFVNLIVHCCQ